MAEEKAVPLHRERLNLPDKTEHLQISVARAKRLKRDMALVFNSVEGRNVLRYMMDIGGFKKIKIGGNAQLGMDVLTTTLYNTSREQLLLEIFELVPAHILRDAEYGVDEDIEL